ncbi:hypothetical protein Tco_1072440, partial [Tanacetum coccineum]
MDRLPSDAIGIYSEFLWFLGIRIPFSTLLLYVLKYFKVHILQLVPIEMSIYDFMTLPSWSDAKVVEESHHLSLLLLDRIPSHTTAPAAEGAIISLPTPDKIAASLSDSRLAKDSKGPSQARVHSTSDTTPEPSWPSKKRKLKKRASEAGSSAPELYQAEGVDDTDLADFCTEIEDRLERDEGVSTRVVSVPIPHLCKRLGAPPSIAVVSASKPSHVGTSAPACTSGRSLSLGGVVVSGRAGKSGAEVMQRQLDPLDSLARSTLVRDAEYDQIPDDDFGTATRVEEIYLTLFPLAPSPYHMPYPYE